MAMEPTFDVAYAAKRVNEGATIAEVARELNRTRKTIRRHLQKINVRAQVKGRPPGLGRRLTIRRPVVYPMQQLIDAIGVHVLSDASKRAGYHRMTVRRWLRGEAVPRLDAFLDLAQTVGCEIIVKPLD